MISQLIFGATLSTQPLTTYVPGVVSAFISCAGFFDVAADQHYQLGRLKTGDEYNGAANGARLVAELLSFEALPDVERREEFLETGYGNAFAQHLAAAQRGEIIPDEVERCFDLQPLQFQLLNEMSHEFYLVQQ